MLSQAEYLFHFDGPHFSPCQEGDIANNSSVMMDKRTLGGFIYQACLLSGWRYLRPGVGCWKMDAAVTDFNYAEP